MVGSYLRNSRILASTLSPLMKGTYQIGRQSLELRGFEVGAFNLELLNPKPTTLHPKRSTLNSNPAKVEDFQIPGALGLGFRVT